MHTAISCASCTRPLRIPAELVGQTVRCPFCTDAFTAVADPTIKVEEATLKKSTVAVEAPAYEPGVVALLESEPEAPVVEESFTVDLEGPVKVKPPKPWSTWVFVKNDSDRRLWGEMQAEISAEGLRLYRGRKELIVPIGCEATWVRGGLVRVVVGSRTVDFQIQKRHVYKARLAADVVRFLNGEQPMPPANKGYRWPWYQWLLLLAPLGLIAVLIAGELPETASKPLKGFAVFLLGVLMPVLAYILWNIERLPVRARWVTAGLLVGGAYLTAGSMYYFGPNLPPAAPYAIWTDFAPPGGRYHISMPAPPLTESEFANGMNFVKSTARVQKNQTFMVAYADLFGLTNQHMDQWERESAFERGRDYIRYLYPKGNYYKWARDKDITLDEHPGKEATFDQGTGRDRVTITVRQYLIGQRLYILFISSAEGSNGLKFLDSFRIDVPGRADLPSPLNWNGLLAYWSFDANDERLNRGLINGKEGGLVIEEKSRQPSDLNSCRWTRSGIRGGAVELTGEGNSHITYGNNMPDLNFKDKAPFSFAGWFKTQAQDGVLLSQSSNTDPMAVLNITVERGRLTAEIHRDGHIELDSAQVGGPANVSDGKWHHFTLTRDQTGVKLYLDGLWQSTAIEAGGQGPITTNLRAFGCELLDQRRPNLQAPAFTGTLDEICIFSRALTPNEIKQLAGIADQNR